MPAWPSENLINAPRTTLDTHYDVIVIGAGVGGLTTGLYLAKVGMKVLILEKHWVVGGCSSSFRKNGFYFDAGAHYLSSCREEGQVGRLLNDHNLASRLTLLRPDPSDVVVIPPLEVPIRPGLDALVSAFQDQFPGQASEIRVFFEFVWNTDAMTLYVKLKDRTFDSVLREFITDLRLRSILEVLLGNIGVPASRASALASVFMFREFVVDGGYYPIGGMQRFCDVLAEQFQTYGGTLCVATAVDQVLTEGCKVTGVLLSRVKNRQIPGGLVITSDYVVANCDPIQLTTRLLRSGDRVHLAVAETERRVPSISAFMLHLGTRKSIKEICRHKAYIWYYPDWDVDRCYRDWMDGQVDFGDSFLFCGFPSFHDPALAPAGKDSVHIIIGAPYKDANFWQQHKERLADSAIRRAERFIPGLSGLIELKLIATPQTLERYTWNYRGAMYGWASTPDQVGEHRFGDTIGLDNLYLAGHWSGPPAGQGGIPMVVYAGRSVANQIVRSVRRRTYRSGQLAESSHATGGSNGRH
ncbi:MAG: hypothetical protein FD131_4817 [Rhodocyclaceae bacterium]|nr:MAG: hypothetical protein FD131_4817 [Rhodocyclaceae bacterium]